MVYGPPSGGGIRTWAELGHLKDEAPRRARAQGATQQAQDQLEGRWGGERAEPLLRDLETGRSDGAS